MRGVVMKRTIGLLAAAFVAAIAFSAGSAEAAILYISEFANGVTFIGSSQAQIPPAPPITDQVVTINDVTSTPSAPFSAKTHVVRLICDEGCSIAFGSSPATVNNYLLQQGVAVAFGVSPGDSVAVIGNPAGDTGGSVVGTVTIDQSNPGATNGVSPQIAGSTYSFGSGLTDAGTQRTTQASDSPVVVGVGAPADAAWTTGNGSLVATTKAIDRDIKNGTVTLGQATMANSIPVTQASDQSYGTTYFLQPTASTNALQVKGSPGVVHWVLVENNSATVNYLRFYNVTGTPTCSSATSLITQIQIPASVNVGGVNAPLILGIPFSTGIGICVTSGYATTDVTNATASAMSLTIGYN